MFILDFFLLFYKIFSAENHGFFFHFPRLFLSFFRLIRYFYNSSVYPGIFPYFCYFSGLSSQMTVISTPRRWRRLMQENQMKKNSFSFFIAKICCFRNIFHKPLLPLNNTPLIHKLKQFGISFFHSIFFNSEAIRQASSRRNRL